MEDMAYVYLFVAIIGETIGTAAVKASDGFTRPGFALLAIAGYGVAAFLLSLTTRTVPIGIAYAIWCGAGIVLISLFGYLRYGQTLDGAALAGIGLIVAGVAVLNLLSTSVHP
jgi:small multidrug resistance pump